MKKIISLNTLKNVHKLLLCLLLLIFIFVSLYIYITLTARVTAQEVTSNVSFIFIDFQLVPSSSPIITLDINGTPNGGLPVVVNQNAPASLTWQVANADNNTCNASVTSVDGSAVPAALDASWKGIKGPPPTSGGPVLLYTDVSGQFFVKLTCQNSTGPSTASMQLNINQYPPAYIQTTGGDVHSNKSIDVAPN